MYYVYIYRERHYILEFISTIVARCYKYKKTLVTGVKIQFGYLGGPRLFSVSRPTALMFTSEVLSTTGYGMVRLKPSCPKKIESLACERILPIFVPKQL